MKEAGCLLQRLEFAAADITMIKERYKNPDEVSMYKTKLYLLISNHIISSS
jgi:hypothetical protein